MATRRDYNRKLKRTRNLSKYGRYHRWYSAGNMLGYAGAAITALKVAKQVKALYGNIEYKNYDIEATELVGTTEYTSCLNAPAQGDTSVTRDGDSVKGRSLYLRMTITHNASATTDTNIRMLIVKDNENNLPSTTNPTFASNDYAVMDEGSMTGMVYLRNKNRYKILMDRVFTITPSDGNRSIIFTKFYRRFADETPFIDGTQKAPKKNGLWLMLISTDNTNKPTVKFQSRYRFIDN